MKIGDVAPSAVLRAPGPNASSVGFLRRLGSVQRAYQARRPARLYEVADQLSRRRELDLRRERLTDAARALASSAPEARYTESKETEITGVERVATSREVLKEREVTRAARPASQTSIAFASADDVVAANKSQLQLRLDSGSDLKVTVGKEGASLRDLADAINSHSKNQGRVEAEIVSSPEGFRLQIATTATGSQAELTIKKDDLRTPDGEKSSLIDLSMAQAGRDESSETVVTSETIQGSRRVVHTREIETREQVADAEFHQIAEEFAAAYNALRTFVDEEGLDVGDRFGRVGREDQVRVLSDALGQITSSLEARASGSDATLADLGFEVDASGALGVDTERLQQAIDRDATSVIELLGGGGSGLGEDVLRALAPPEDAAPADPTAGLEGFLSRLSARQGSLQQESDLLGTIVQALGGDGGPEGSA